MLMLAIVAVLCSVGALVLNFLCIFAGSSTSFLQNLDILTVNTSMLGKVQFNRSDDDGGPLGQIEGQAESGAEKGINGFVGDVAEALGIRDFYSAHLLDFCEGFYIPSSVANQTFSPNKDVTACSNKSAGFTFDLTEVLQQELRPGISLADLQWPDELRTAAEALTVASKVTFVFYCLATTLTFVGAIGGIFGAIARGVHSAMWNSIIDFLAFLACSIASGIVTAIMAKVINAIQEYGSRVGVQAYRGINFLAMTWTATGLMLLATILWILVHSSRVGRRRRGYAQKSSY